jgi:hypothetical protein
MDSAIRNRIRGMWKELDTTLHERRRLLRQVVGEDVGVLDPRGKGSEW